MKGKKYSNDEFYAITIMYFIPEGSGLKPSRPWNQNLKQKKSQSKMILEP